MEVVQFVPQLGKALWDLKLMYDQHVDNKTEIKELLSFIQDYENQVPVLRKRLQECGGNVMGIAAFQKLEKDVMEATNELERWSRDKSFFRVFNSSERMQKLVKVHSKVMASVQKSLGIANVSMLLDLQANQAITHATLLESHAELKSLLITSIGCVRGTLPAQVREEVVDASTSSFGDPKFWEDILAAVDEHHGIYSVSEENNVYEDPITANLMIDPIVASDGNTYCRWTIIDNNVTTSPFNVDEDLTILIDNLNFRRVLFEKFPRQSQIFRQRRNEYRSRAFALKAKGLLGDAAIALHHVLQWDKRDAECVEALGQVQAALQEAKEKYLQAPAVQEAKEKYLQAPALQEAKDKYLQAPALQEGKEKYLQAPALQEAKEKYLQAPALQEAKEKYLQAPAVQEAKEKYSQAPALQEVKEKYLQAPAGPSYVPSIYAGPIGSSMDKTVFVPPRNRDAASELLPDLLSSVPEVQQRALLLFLHMSLDRAGAMSDALEPLALVLTEGSTPAREQAAKVLFNLSHDKHSDKRLIGKSGVLPALVTSLGQGPLQVQQIVASILRGLFYDFPNRMRAVEAGLVPVLLGLMEPRQGSMWEEALTLMNIVLDGRDPDTARRLIQDRASPSLWLEFVPRGIAVESSERPDEILCNLFRRERRQQRLLVRLGRSL